MPASAPALAYTGQLAALGTACCWAFSALAFSTASQRMGVMAVNLIRLVIGFGFLSLAAWGLRGLPLPVDASPRAWGWLAVSGLVGFVFGDLCLFKAYLLIGPRLASLLMSLAPLLTALIGWLVLGETLTGRDALGMTLTVAGIAWAVLERRPATPEGAREGRASPAGVALAVCGALGQAGGLVLSKLGMGEYDAVASTQVRVLAGIAGFSLVLTVAGRWREVGAAVRERRGLGFAALGAFFGPFLGVSLSLFAVRHTVAGVAASIMAVQPVLLIPLVVILHRERVGLGGIGGTVLATIGVALLFL